MHCKGFLLTLAVAGALSSTAAQAVDIMDIYKEAYVRDPVVNQAKANRDAAYSQIDAATADLLPQIDVTASYTATKSKYTTGSRGNNRNANIGISLSQAIWKHSAWMSRSIAEKNATMQDLIYNNALQNLIIRVSTAYFDVLNANDTVIYARANRDALKNQLDDATQRYDVGLIAETDRLEAQASYDLASAQVITAENSLINSYTELRKLIGRDENDLAILNTRHFSPAAIKESLEQIIKNAEENNLALMADLVSMDIAKDNIALARTGHEPTLDLVASASTGYTDYSNNSIIQNSQEDGNSHSAAIGLQLNFPIYHGGATSAAVDEAIHNYTAASEAAEYTHRSTIADANTGYNNVNSAISSVKAYQQLERSAESALRATSAGYEVGTRTITDVLDATQALYSAKENLASARYNYIKSRLNLLYTEGSLEVTDLEAVNKGLISSRRMP